MERETDPDPHELAAEILSDRPAVVNATPNETASSGTQYIDIAYEPEFPDAKSDFNLSKQISRRLLNHGLIVTAVRVGSPADPNDARVWVNNVRVAGTEFEADI